MPDFFFFGEILWIFIGFPANLLDLVRCILQFFKIIAFFQCFKRKLTDEMVNLMIKKKLMAKLPGILRELPNIFLIK